MVVVNEPSIQNYEVPVLQPTEYPFPRLERRMKPLYEVLLAGIHISSRQPLHGYVLCVCAKGPFYAILIASQLVLSESACAASLPIKSPFP